MFILNVQIIIKSTVNDTQIALPDYIIITILQCLSVVICVYTSDPLNFRCTIVIGS